MDHILPFARQYDMLPPGVRVLCAVSGGADSVALLHFLKTHGFDVAAAHLDHHLRPTSGRDAAFVAQLCRELEVPLLLGEERVDQMAGNTEDNARRVRYAFLERAAGELGAGRIATAHNAGDNLETVLLHLTRGCGLRGLTGIQPRRGMLVRPMLRTVRPAIEAYLAENGLSHITDETNLDDSYARNRLRHQVIPVLETINPRVAQAAGRMTGHLLADLERLPPPEEEPVALPPLERRAVAIGERVDTPLWTLETWEGECTDQPPTPSLFCLGRTQGMALRARATGDFLHPPFRRGKSVKKWMIELKIPRWQREAIPVLTAGDTLLSVAGIGPQAHALARPGERGVFARWTKR